MGIKIHSVNWKQERRICISYDSLQYRRKTKTFKVVNMTEALDFALNLDNRYIDSCSDEIYNFAVKIDHDILTKKDWCFT